MKVFSNIGALLDERRESLCFSFSRHSPNYLASITRQIMFARASGLIQGRTAWQCSTFSVSVAPRASSKPTSVPTLIHSPAVQSLLRHYGIKDADRIAATGPRGRLTKGDILAHLNKIEAVSNAKIAEAYNERSKLDLSNIKRLSRPVPEVVAPIEPEMQIIELQKAINIAELLKLSERFKREHGTQIDIYELTAKAAQKALQDVPEFGLAKVSEDDKLFAEIVGFPTERKSSHLTPLKRQIAPDEALLPDASVLPHRNITLPNQVPQTALLNLVARPSPIPGREAVSSGQGTSDIFDYLLDIPSQVPMQPTSYATDYVASLSFETGRVDSNIASLYLDRIAQYVESPGYLMV